MDASRSADPTRAEINGHGAELVPTIRPNRRCRHDQVSFDKGIVNLIASFIARVACGAAQQEPGPIARASDAGPAGVLNWHGAIARARLH